MKELILILALQCQPDTANRFTEKFAEADNKFTEAAIRAGIQTDSVTLSPKYYSIGKTLTLKNLKNGQ